MKVKVRFLFHTPKNERFIGKVIVIWTGFLALFYGKGKALKYNFSHEEVQLPDEYGLFVVIKTSTWSTEDDTEKGCGRKFVGQCISSTTRGVYNGVRFAPAHEVIGKHPDRWKYIECEVDAERLEVAVAEAKRLVGRKYDFLGIFGFVNPFPIQAKNRWYCSEICNWFAFLCRIVPKLSKRISPRRAAYELAKTWGEPKPV